MKSPISTQKVKVLDNIGLGLFLFSIVSIVFWSPSSYSFSRGLDNVIDKISEKEHFFVEKAKSIPVKLDFAIKDTIGGMKIDIEKTKDLYKNSLTHINEENVKPTLNKISNWVGIGQDPSIIQEHLSKPEEACETRDASKNIGKRDLDASYITSNDLKETIDGQNIELYKQTISDQSNDWIPDDVHKVFDKSKLIATSTIGKTDEWVADRAHHIFDKSGSIVDVVENEVDKIVDTTFQEMHTKKPINFLNNSVSKIVKSLEAKVCQEDLNESNILHNNLQLLGTNNIEDDVENTTNTIHNNMRFLGVDNSNNFITKNTHKNAQKLDELHDQMSKDTRINSFTTMNNLKSKFLEDAKINEVKNEFNPQKELDNSWNDKRTIYDQNNFFDEDTRKHHQELNAQQYKHFQSDYDDDTNYGGVKERMRKYVHRTYEGSKVSGNTDYKGSKYIQPTKNHAHFHQRDAKHKASEFYKPMEDGIQNFGKDNQYNEYDDEYNEYDDGYNEYDDDEDFYDEF